MSAAPHTMTVTDTLRTGIYPLRPEPIPHGAMPSLPFSATTLRIMEIVGDGIACFTPEAACIWANTAYARACATAPAAERLERDIMQNVRATIAAHLARAAAGDPPSMVRQVRVAGGRLHLTALVAPSSGPGTRETVVVVLSAARAGRRFGDDAELRRRYKLTVRESQVADLLLEGKTNAEVATMLAISPHTARHHTERVFIKLGLRSRAAVGARLRAD